MTPTEGPDPMSGRVVADLFSYADARDGRVCEACTHLDGKPLDSGVRYCFGLCVWRFPDDPVCERALFVGPSWRPPWFALHPAEAA